jgi:hypothetical protein
MENLARVVDELPEELAAAHDVPADAEPSTIIVSSLACASSWRNPG